MTLRIEPAMYHITATVGPLKGMAWRIGDTPVVIGRSHHCDIVLADSAVSRRHCRLSRDEGVLRCEDLESANTTLLNGSPVHRAELRAGDQVQVGTTTFIVSSDDVGFDQSARVDDSTTITLAEEEVSFLEESPDASTILGEPQTVQDLIMLFGVGRELSQAKSLQDLLETLYGWVRERFGTRKSWVLRLHGVDRLSLCAVAEHPDTHEAELPVEPCRRAVTTERALMVLEPDSMLLVAPMRASGAVLGVVAVRTSVKQGAAAKRDLEFLLALASQAAPFFLSVEHADALRQDLERLRRVSGESTALVGESKPVQRLRTLLQQAAASDLSVMILGETGTGKELAARMVHDASNRANGPFVVVNCAAIPQELLESELFGYEKGAFTGASARKPGRFEEAHGGTLFLDEVGDLSLNNQARVLRAIELGTFHRLGSQQQTEVDVRIVCATNCDLSRAVAGGTFRQDLYHRLRGVEIVLPPLRERESDIPLLAEHFLSMARPQAKRPIAGFTDEAMAYLRELPWPGNVRELKTAIERAVVFATSDRIDRDVLEMFAAEASRGDDGQGVLMSLAEVERQHIESVLRECGGNMSATARVLEISRATLYNKVRDYNIRA
jgi:DNA-binding NtrC family response regulator